MGVRAYAPGTVANLGPGFDVLGLALEGAGDTVLAERSESPGVTIRSAGHSEIPTDPAGNTAGIAASAVLRRAGVSPGGVVLEVRKGLPLSGGQGGSAASAAAAAVATNALYGSPFSRADLLEPCLEAEEAVSGRHADNVAAALYGGLILVASLDPLDIVEISWPRSLRVVLAEPEQTSETGASRARLPASVGREVAVAQAASLAALVSALAAADFDRVRRALHDRIAEPVRAAHLAGFREAKAAALEAGAFGCSISGSGPAAFALAVGEDMAVRIGSAMVEAYALAGVRARFRSADVDRKGARVLAGEEA
jgi:homoserine kinase